MTAVRAKTETCPAWCAQRHDDGADDADLHIGGALLVQRTVLRLCTSIDTSTGRQDGPFILVGDVEYTLHEAEALAAALTQLVDQGRPQGSWSGPDNPLLAEVHVDETGPRPAEGTYR